MQLLEEYDLVDPYRQLIQCLKVGNLQGYLDHLEAYFVYFYQHLTYVLLKERGIVLVWRCLIRNMQVTDYNEAVNGNLIYTIGILRHSI